MNCNREIDDHFGVSAPVVDDDAEVWMMAGTDLEKPLEGVVDGRQQRFVRWWQEALLEKRPLLRTERGLVGRWELHAPSPSAFEHWLTWDVSRGFFLRTIAGGEKCPDVEKKERRRVHYTPTKKLPLCKTFLRSYELVLLLILLLMMG